MNNNNDDGIIKEYTIYQIQNLFSNLLLANSLLKENQVKLTSLNRSGKSDTKHYSNLKRDSIKISEIIDKVGREVLYILQNPTRIKIKEIPIKGILNQRKLISKLNRDSENKIRNLRKMFYDVKDKFTINHNHLPEEYSTKYLDNSIRMHKESIRKLLKLKEKLTGRKEISPFPNDNRSFFEVLLDCPNPLNQDFFSYISDSNQKNSFNEKEAEIRRNEERIREEEKRSIRNFKTFLDKTLKTF